jgi:uncharacterized integral membrane protein
MRRIVYLGLLILAVIILIQNTAVVAFQILFWEVSMSKAILAFLLLLVGFLIGVLTAKFRRKLF